MLVLSPYTSSISSRLPWLVLFLCNCIYIERVSVCTWLLNSFFSSSVTGMLRVDSNLASPQRHTCWRSVGQRTLQDVSQLAEDLDPCPLTGLRIESRMSEIVSTMQNRITCTYGRPLKSPFQDWTIQFWGDNTKTWVHKKSTTANGSSNMFVIPTNTEIGYKPRST